MRTTNYEPPLPPPQLKKAAETRGNGWAKPRIEEVPMDGHYRALYRQALEEEPVAPWERGNGHDEAPVVSSGEGPDEASFSATVNWLSKGAVALDNFRAYMPLHAYIFTPSREMWPAASVNARIPPIPLFDKNGKPLLGDDGKQRKISASAWIDKHLPVEMMTWAPGEPMLIPNLLISDGGWIEHPKAVCFNLYRPPMPRHGGNGAEARRWLDHAEKVYPFDAEHIVKWLAHRVQHPEQKINHALILGGNQGVGKDTLLEPVKRAIGPWNFLEVSPQQTLEPYNGFLKSVILRVNEARDLGDVDRFKFYDHMKAYTAAPPDVLRVNEKYLKAHYVFIAPASLSRRTTRRMESSCQPMTGATSWPGPI